MVDAALFVEERDRLGAGAFAFARVYEPHWAGRAGLGEHGAHHFAALIGFGDDRVRVPAARRIDSARGPTERREAMGAGVFEHVGVVAGATCRDHAASRAGMTRLADRWR